MSNVKAEVNSSPKKNGGGRPTSEVTVNQL